MLNNIQALRAIAALLVVMHHAGAHYSAMGGNNAVILTLAQWGYVGVDLFFVISGFIITHTTMSKPRGLQGAATFAWHRLARIFLGYWPFFAVAVAMAIYLPPHSLSSFDLIGSFLLLNPDSNGLVVPISWSLSFELYFYALFVLTFWVPHRLLPKFILGALAVVVLASAVFPPDYRAEPYFFRSGFLIEFFMGAAVRILSTQASEAKIRPWLFAAVAIGTTAGLLIGAISLPYRAFTFGIAGAAVVALLVSFPNKPRRGVWSVIDAIGDSSYTIYLSHLSLISLFYHTGLRDFFTTSAGPLPEIGLAALLVTCIAFSHGFYRLVELPVYRLATGKLRRRTPPNKPHDAAVSALSRLKE